MAMADGWIEMGTKFQVEIFNIDGVITYYMQTLYVLSYIWRSYNI